MNIVLLGAPGSGKGTCCKFISQKYGLSHIAMGDIFRKNIEDNTKIGKEAEKYINKGELVPDEIAIKVLEDTINSLENIENGIVFDGYPRTIMQAKKLDEFLNKKNKKIDCVINLQISEKEIVSRIVNRRICSNSSCAEIYNLISKKPKIEGVCDKCGHKLVKRNDDNEETILKRLKSYDILTKPLIKYYIDKKILKNVEGENLDYSIMKILDSIN